MKIGIIGTAGRKDDAAKMSVRVYNLMYKKLLYIMDGICPEVFNRDLVSGGAAWADHLAVRAFNESQAAKLTLYIPTQWDTSKEKYPKFKASREVDWITNPGGTINYYHAAFSKKLGWDTLAEIEISRRKGANLIPSTGFHARNTALANEELDALIAFTWGKGDTPKVGGTLDTWNKSKAELKIHIPISTLL